MSIVKRYIFSALLHLQLYYPIEITGADQLTNLYVQVDVYTLDQRGTADNGPILAVPALRGGSRGSDATGSNPHAHVEEDVRR